MFLKNPFKYFSDMVDKYFYMTQQDRIAVLTEDINSFKNEILNKNKQIIMLEELNDELIKSVDELVLELEDSKKANT